MFYRSVAAGSALTSAALFALVAAGSAQASSIGVAGNWSSETVAEQNPENVVLEFSNLATLAPGDGFLTGYSAQSIGELVLQRDSFTTNSDGVFGLYSLNTSAFTGQGWKTYQDDLGNQIIFNLDLDATWQRFYDTSDGDTSWAQDENSEGLFEYTGAYTLADGTTVRGTGVLNASASGAAQLFENTQQAGVIPLPASAFLLIGASGILGFIGRRKNRA